jgi:hypothetical protein
MKLMRLMTGHRIAQAIRAVAEIGVADSVADGASTTEQIAARRGRNATTLHRVMRAVAGTGTFEHRPLDS